jgi:4-amino-4-deoxy-L-arabinose transferase-like glycosyltransferase
MPFSFRNISPVRLALFLLCLITLFRLWYATRVGLVADEAYYWLWAKHPALSYRDKGPLVAWIIWLGTKIFGDTVFGIRFLGVIMSSAVGWLIFVLARRLYDAPTALWCILMALAIPEMAVGSILMTIDTPSVFFWALSVLLFWDALHNDKISTWFWLGLSIGAGFLAKFTNGVQLICIGFFLLWVKEHRHLLFSRKVFVMCVAFGLASLPILIWNMQTGWIHFTALHSRSGVTDSFHIRPDQWFKFIGLQFGIISPLFMTGMVVAAVGLLLKRHQDLKVRFLLSQYLPIYALFSFFALNNSGQPNWTVPALVTGIIFTVVFWRELAVRSIFWRCCVVAAYAITLLVVAALHAVDIFHLPAKDDPFRRAEGWPDFAAHIQEIRKAQNADVLIGSTYQYASLMAFYLPDRPTTYLPPGPYGSSQFTLWPEYKTGPATRALFVTGGPQKIPVELQSQFTQVNLIDDFWTQYNGRPTQRICVYLCTEQ